MAQMGLKYLVFAPIQSEPENAIPVYEAGGAFVVGRMIDINTEISNAEGELSADDMIAEYVSEFSSALMTASVDNISLENQAKLYGAEWDEEEGYKAYDGDVAPYGGIGGYQVLMINGQRKYRPWFYPKAKAIMPNLKGNTKGKSISFGTESLKMKVTSPKFGPWYYSHEFDTEAEAKAYIDTKLGVTSGN